uniref:Uncharacterized protein n=1 Tax=Paramormyrops kingsleyae TaxID=1676925 RepID=A0A3B3SAJ2_9TELE
ASPLKKLDKTKQKARGSSGKGGVQGWCYPCQRPHPLCLPTGLPRSPASTAATAVCRQAGHWIRRAGLMSLALNHRTAEWFYAYFICISLNQLKVCKVKHHTDSLCQFHHIFTTGEISYLVKILPFN